MTFIKEAVNETELSAVIMIEHEPVQCSAVNAYFLGFGESVLPAAQAGTAEPRRPPKKTDLKSAP